MRPEIVNRIIKNNKTQLPVFSKKWKFENYTPTVIEKYNKFMNAKIPNNIISYKIF